MRDDPYRTLGLAPGAPDEQIRSAYLARLRESPPDRDPAQFEKIRDAYERLSDPRQRAALVLDADPDPLMVSLLEPAGARRPAAGLDLWIEAVMEARRGR